MANQTVKDAMSVKGTNPQYLVEKIIRYCVGSTISYIFLTLLWSRSRIYDSKYWKENCFALTAELLVDKAMELRFYLVWSPLEDWVVFPQVYWRGVWRQHQTHPIPLSCSQDAADPAGKGHRDRVHQERGLQVRARSGRLLPQTHRNRAWLLQVSRAAAQWLPEDQITEEGWKFWTDPHGRVHWFSIARWESVRRSMPQVWFARSRLL